MPEAPTGLAWPPEDRSQFDEFPTRAVTGEIHRLTEHPGSSWWYTSRAAPDGVGAGRFDLVAPDGTTYWAASFRGALFEKTLRRPKKIVARERLDELFHGSATVVEPPEVADFTASRAVGFGLNAEVHTTLDYRRPNRWADAIRDAGTAGIAYRLRSDPAVAEIGFALFGSAGSHRRAPAGMRTATGVIDVDRAVAALERVGVTVLPVPNDVPTIPPRDPPRRDHRR